jgi:hypothetical protein
MIAEGDVTGHLLSLVRPVLDRRPRIDPPSRATSGAVSPRFRSPVVELALEQAELSPRELAVRFTDAQGYFVLEATVYRLLKTHDPITNLAFIVIKAAKSSAETQPHMLRQRTG